MRKIELDDTGKKQCPRCGERKLEDQYYERKSGGTQSWCKACIKDKATVRRSADTEKHNAQTREWYLRNQERNRQKKMVYWRKRAYGLEDDVFQELLKSQNFCCAICDEPFAEKRQYVDHCHSGGGVRGLLCNKCNIGLHYVERTEYLEAAIAYLERHRSQS